MPTVGMGVYLSVTDCFFDPCELETLPMFLSFFRHLLWIMTNTLVFAIAHICNALHVIVTINVNNNVIIYKLL